MQVIQHPGGVPDPCDRFEARPSTSTPPGCEHRNLLSGALRFAPTSGYFLGTLRVTTTVNRRLKSEFRFGNYKLNNLVRIGVLIEGERQ